MSDTPDINAVVTVESGGRTLSGAGVSEEALQSTIDAHEERHAPAETPAAPDASEPVKPTRGQARFSELTSKRKEAESRAEAAERKAAELEARLSQQVPSQQIQPGQAPWAGTAPVTERPQPRQEPPATRPKPSEDDIGTTYPTYADFVEDLSDWKAEQRLAQLDFQGQIRQHLEQERTRQTFDTHVEAVRAKGRAAYADFNEMLKSGPGTFVDMPVAAVHAIMEHPQSHHLQYQIMKDGALAQKLAGLAFSNPYAFSFELAKLAPAEQPSNGGRPQPAPPAPMQPVGSGSRSSTPTSAEAAASGSYEEYKARRTAERRGRR